MHCHINFPYKNKEIKKKTTSENVMEKNEKL